jgi:hypothetical protein
MSRNESTFPFFDEADLDTEPHTASPTSHLLDELALHGYRPGQDESDPRPLPEPDAVRGQLGAMVEALSAMLTGTRLEDDLADLLWSFVNLFHRKTARIEHQLDTNEQAQRRGQAEQDGSEVKSIELERLIAQGISLIDPTTAKANCPAPSVTAPATIPPITPAPLWNAERPAMRLADYVACRDMWRTGTSMLILRRAADSCATYL